MTTITISDKFQGRGGMRHLDEPWQELLKFDGGTFSETDTQISFIATNGQVVDVKKRDIADITNNYIVYRGTHKKNIDSLVGGSVFVVQSNNDNKRFTIKSTLGSGFYLVVDLSNEASNDKIDTDDYLKKVELDGQHLAYLANAFARGLFPKPETGELLYKTISHGKCVLFFKLDYYEKLMTVIEKSYDEGLFASSNSEREWNNLKYTLKCALIEKDTDKSLLQAYSLPF